MRGLAMLLVVVGHVFYFSFKDTDNVLFRILSLEIQIPLFFMVSGFLVRMPKCDYLSFFRKKTFLLCVPATIFMTIYAWIYDYNYVSAWIDDYKQGYWFTFTLFEFIVLYAMLKLISRKMKLSLNTEHFMFIIVAIILLFASVLCMRIENQYFIIPLFGLLHLKSFVYFILGVILAERQMLCDNISPMKLRGTALLLICFLFHFYTYKGSCVSRIGSYTLYTLWFALITISGLLVLLWGFKQYVSWSSSWIGKWLQIIGRYTLDIYFIHYFFLPRNLSLIGDWFKINSNPLIEYMLALFIAIMLIVVSLFVGRLIRLSPILAHWLLAENKDVVENNKVNK